MTDWSPHGAARRAAGFAPDPELPPEPPAVEPGSRFPGREVHLGWELARALPGLSADERAAVTAVLAWVRAALAAGSTRVDLDDDWASAVVELGFPVTPVVGDVLGRLRDPAPDDPLGALVGPPGSRRPLVREGRFVAPQRVHAVEVRLAERLRARLTPPDLDEAAVEGAIGAVEAVDSDPPRFRLHQRQREAVGTALRHRLCAIRGGPGTGKTAIVVTLVRAAVAAGVAQPVDIALAAPTGKAADRLRTSIDATLRGLVDPPAGDLALRTELAAPRTLHRLLGLRPGRSPLHHAGNPLAERLVIVDEASMIDLLLMERLVDALAPDAHLVLLGDADQLPSVAAGAVFRDLGRAPSVPAVALTESYRMDPRRPEGANILRVARALRAGETPEALGRLDELPSSLADLGGAHLWDPPPGGLDRFLDRWVTERVVGPPDVAALAARVWPVIDGRVPAPSDAASALEGLFRFASAARLLCVTRSAARATGVEAVNRALSWRFRAHHGRPPGALLEPGEPVVVVRNDHERGLFNGDQGLVLRVRAAGAVRLAAVFARQDGFVAHPVEAVRHRLERGYATTVHKAQGSEHELVTLLLPEVDAPGLWTRELLYTALTRARRAALLVGALPMVSRAAARAVIRSSGLAERLDAAPSSEPSPR